MNEFAELRKLYEQYFEKVMELISLVNSTENFWSDNAKQ